MNWNRKQLTICVGLALVSATTAVLACGPDFPLQLLDDRAGSLERAPGTSFAFDTSQLIPEVDRLEAVEIDQPMQFQTSDLTPQQVEIVLKMRAFDDGDRAFEIGAGLPVAVRLYNAGAVDYARALEADDTAAWSRAEKRFKSILTLPKAEGDMRAAWAAYMIGKMNLFGNRDVARQAFIMTRRRVLDGASDSWGLAVASYGEEALTYLFEDGFACDWYAFSYQEKCTDNISPTNLIKAISLYAEQAARKSYNAENSLRVFATWALKRTDRLAKIIDDPIVQKVLISYALMRFGDDFDNRSSDETSADATTSTALNTNEILSTSQQKLDALMTAILRLPSDRVVGKDRLAALAYRIGNYEFAKQLVGEHNSALADWVRAKLAFRDGDLATAAAAYAKASRFFPPIDKSISSQDAPLMKAEQGVLALARGQYVDALDQLYLAAVEESEEISQDPQWVSGYYHDMAYIAERVLTLDELKIYIDSHVQPSTPPSTPDLTIADKFYEWRHQHPAKIADNLRALLARRLVREGRLAEADSYFPADDDARYAHTFYDGSQFLVKLQRRRQWLAEYSKALGDSKDAWTDIGSAEALFKASTIARVHGMEIMGYEQAPDFTILEGLYDYGIGRSAYDENPLSGSYVTDDERQRYAANDAQPSRRFHYREIASDLAIKAADLLPPRSQAFAATLCVAARYTRDDADRLASLYQRYVEQGAMGAFGESFGEICAEPDFTAAAWFPYKQAWKHMTAWLYHHTKWWIATLVTLAAAGFVVIWQCRQRRQRLHTGHGADLDIDA